MRSNVTAKENVMEKEKGSAMVEMKKRKEVDGKRMELPNGQDRVVGLACHVARK